MNLNVWDYVLFVEEIEILLKLCLLGDGNVVRWIDLICGCRGKIKLVILFFCKLLNV